MPAGALHAAAASVATYMPPWALGGPVGGRGCRSHTSLATAFDDAGGGGDEGGGDHHDGGGSKDGGDSKDSSNKDAEGGKEGGSGKTLQFTTQTGKTITVSGESRSKCIESCNQAPELKDSNQSGLGSVLSAASGGERQNIADCMHFCEAEFELFCFPGDSTVVVRDRGRVPLAELRAGEAVLAVGHQESDAGGCWELLFDTVITWLHRDPDVEGEVLQLRHEAGQVQLTANHLLFVQKPGKPSAVPLLASEVRPGDRLLAPWIDGSLAMPAVLGVERAWRRGLFAPLVGCGTVLVDGTAASCYALPRNLQTSTAIHRLAGLADGAGLHAAAHSLFLPLRLLYSAAPLHGRRLLAKGQPGLEDLPKQMAEDTTTCRKGGEALPIHPYAWVLYVVAASFLV